MTNQPNRLPDGGRIDRSRTLSFRFDGKRLQGHPGDTVASALLANGVSLVGRSFKLHRPRGIVGCGPEEPNAILQVGTGATTDPNHRATEVELVDGMTLRSTRGWPGLRFDVGAINDRLGRTFSAGFYYKTFMFPRRGWPLYEHIIRRSAGFGRAPVLPDPDRYEHVNAHCDVLVAGAGPAGLMAALAAARSGARVMLADDQPEFGGRLLSSTERIDDKPGGNWVAGIVAELQRHEDVVLLPRSSVFGYYDHNFLAIAERCHPDRNSSGPSQRLWRVRARHVVLAQGAFERPLVFCNNDRPGVMLASAVSTYINRYAVLPGRRAVVFTNNDSAYQTAADLSAAGADVVIVDSRPGGAGDGAQAATGAGIPVLRGHIVTDIRGERRVRQAAIAAWNGDSTATVDNTIHIDCELVAMSGGWSPAVHLHSQAGGKNVWDEDLAAFVPGKAAQPSTSAGAGNGRWLLGDCLRDGLRAGRDALSDIGIDAAEVDLPQVKESTVRPIEPLWRVPSTKDPDRCAKQFVDYQNDTSVGDIRLAVREGYRNVEHVKRYTALGFGTDQGKLGNINGMAILAETLNRSIPEVGTTTFRPAYTPVTFGVGAGESIGDLYDPIRKTAMHEWHEAARAPMEIVGQWHRPWYFPRDGEDPNAAVARECLAVRNGVGMMDASTLGKIDACGADVVTFLERIYTHNVGKMAVGRCAYGILLGEDGMVIDDGVMARTGEERYYLTTTTGGAANVLAWLEKWLQTEWPDLDVYLTSLTDHFSTIAVAGPDSRRVLESLDCSVPLDKKNFPFMTCRRAILAGFAVTLFRVSFSGELAFEVNIDSSHALEMWKRIYEAGRAFEIAPYGTETMHVLRAEKGFPIIGQDTDGSVSPVDLGLNWLLSKDKDYLGRRSLLRSDTKREDRKHFVGLRSLDDETVLPEGAPLIASLAEQAPMTICGHVTSSYQSACLGHPIALALVAGGRRRKGETIYASLSDGEPVAVEIVSPVFYDPKSERQHV